MKSMHDLILCRRLEIDQYILATDDIHPGKWRILQKVMRRINDHFPDTFCHLVMTVNLYKKFFQSFRRYILQCCLMVNTSPCSFNSFIVQVSGKDLDRRGDRFFTKIFQDNDRDRDRFLTCCTSRYPYPERIFHFAVPVKSWKNF